MVPHLITALTGPINELEQRVLESMPAIERWFRLEWMEHTPPFYSSVDIRNAGFKLAPVDTNLFPGGFNHLTPEMLPLAVQAAMAAIEKICPEAKNLLLIPEKHTRNTFYLANVKRLMQIFHQAGLNVRLGTLDPEARKARGAELPESFHSDPLVYQGGSDDFLGPCDDALFASEDWGIDFEAEVAVVPGEAFGTPGYLRLSYAASVPLIVEGVRRLAAGLAAVAAAS